jgi:glycosyltransferase involved in cell wall biosynthesis
MGEMLTLSIVTPSYNTGKYLGAAVRSVLEQDWPAVHYAVMDGGSTDNSLDVLRSFGPRVQWISEKDKGQSDAINKGFARAKGEVLSWLNSDDTYAPGAFRAAMEYFQANPDVGMVYGDANFIDSADHLIGRCVHVEPYSRHRLFHYSDIIVQPAAFFRRSVFEAVGGVDTSLNWAMDYDLWLKIADATKVAYLPRVLANFRWLAGNKTATGGWGRLDEIDRVLSRHRLGTPAYVKLERVNMHVQEAKQAIGQGKLGAAATSLRRATSTLFSSGRALGSMFQPLTWKIIWTGQVLRARAARAEQEEEMQNGK